MQICDCRLGFTTLTIQAGRKLLQLVRVLIKNVATASHWHGVFAHESTHPLLMCARQVIEFAGLCLWLEDGGAM
jgi:hypothetical protein